MEEDGWFAGLRLLGDVSHNTRVAGNNTHNTRVAGIHLLERWLFQGLSGDSWILADSRGSGAAAIEGTVRSVLSPRLAHKTGLNRREIIALLSHFVAP